MREFIINNLGLTIPLLGNKWNGRKELYYDKRIELVTTIEELKSYVDTHCRAGIDCEEENGNPWCINHASPELRDEFASKYGCICRSHCERCCNFKECHPNGLNK